MRLKFLALTIMISSSSLVQANLPDEINYSPYKNEYDELSRQTDEISNSINDVERRLESSYSQEAQDISTIEQLESDRGRLVEAIRQSRAQLRDLEIQAPNLEQRIRRLSGELRDLRIEENSLRSEIEREQRRIAPIKEKQVRALRELKVKENELQDQRRQLQTIKGDIANLESKIEMSKNEIESLRSKIENLKNKLASIDSDISRTQSDLSSIDGEISAAKLQVRAEEAKKESLNSQVESLKQELERVRTEDRASPRIRELRGNIAQKTREIAAQERSIRAAESKVDNLKNKKTALKNKIVSLEQDKSRLPLQIDSAQNEINATRSKMQNLKTKLDESNAKRLSKRNQVDQAMSEVATLQSRLERVNSELEQESVKLDRKIAKLRDVNSTITNVESRFQNRRRELNIIESEIARIRNDIPSWEYNIRNIDTSISQAQRELESSRIEIQRLRTQLSVLTDQESRSMVLRDQKYAQYQSRYNYYLDKKREAEALGDSQTLDAQERGVNDSNSYVENRSLTLGNAIGEELAISEASLWSSVRSEIKGYHDGYADGFSAEDSRNQGEHEGEQAGIRAANDYANTVLKPKFFKEIFEGKIGSLSSSSQMPSPLFADSRVLGNDNSEKEYITYDSAVEPIKSEEIIESKKIITSLDESIEKFKTQLSQVNQKIEEMNNAMNSYLAPEKIPFQKVDCTNVYKRILEFENICKNSYARTFKAKYLASHFQNYEDQFFMLFEKNLQVKRENVIENLYHNGLETFYPIAFDDGQVQGKRDGFNESFALAKTKAYQEQLPRATTNAKDVAVHEVDQWILKNATLTIKDSKIIAEKLRGGSKAKLKLILKNISPASLEQPIKVEITSINRMSVENKVYYIKKAAGSAIVEFEEINLLVDSSVLSNQKVSVEGRITFSGGKYESLRVESFKASAITQVNPTVSVDYNYIKSPSVLTRFRRRTLIHNFDLKITPAVESVRSGYQVKLSAAQGYEGLINLKNTNLVTGAMDFGITKNLRFQYTFPVSAIGKIVKLKVDYIHDGEVIKSEIVELRPN